MINGCFENVVFDLDGTLVDSVPGISASLQAAISSLGLSLPLDDLRRWVGPPLRDMIAQMWPHLDQSDVENLVLAFREDYNRDGCLNSKLYPGMLNELVELSGAAVQLFILTNKPLEPTLRILENLSLVSLFRAVHSPDLPSDPFNAKADGAVRLVSRYQLLPENTLLIGDTDDDREAAEAAGFAFLRAAYGYGHFKAASGSQRWPSLDTPSALPRFLKKETYI